MNTETQKIREALQALADKRLLKSWCREHAQYGCSLATARALKKPDSNPTVETLQAFATALGIET